MVHIRLFHDNKQIRSHKVLSGSPIPKEGDKVIVSREKYFVWEAKTYFDFDIMNHVIEVTLVRET